MVSTRVIPGTTIPEGMMADWRRYATEVEKQKRTPSPITTRMLTETAIAQYESARAAQEALHIVGIGVTWWARFWSWTWPAIAPGSIERRRRGHDLGRGARPEAPRLTFRDPQRTSAP